MLPQNKNKIPSKLHHYPESFLLNGRDLGPMNSSDDRKDNLLIKYSPKYYRSFEIMETWKKSRKAWVLKRMKNINSFSDKDSTISTKNLWRIILQNKFKCVDAYHHNHHFYQERDISRYKAFSQITKIRLFDESRSEISRSRQIKKLPSLALVLSRYLPGMTNLKSLCLEIKSEGGLYLLEKTNLLTKILPSLRTLRIECPRKDILILLQLFKNQNLLKYVTHFSLGRLVEEDSCKVFRFLPKRCKNLTYLSFEVSPNRSFNCSDPYVHTNYLRVLRDFERLEGIRISVQDTLAFMENFAVPSSLKFVSLSFLDTSWYEICQELFTKTLLEFKENPFRDKLFVDTQRARSFSDKFFKLRNLISLELSAQDAPEAADFITSFINSLLPGVPSKLQNLQLNLLPFGSLNQEPSLLNIKDFLFLSSKLFPSLKALKVSIPKHHFVNVGYDEVKDINFPQLSSFEFSGTILSTDLTLQNLFNIVKKPCSVLPPNDVDISLKTEVLGSELLNLLKILKNPPRNSRVKALILLTGYKQEKEAEKFVENEKNLPIVQSVALTFGINDYYSEYEKSLSLLSQVFGEVSFKTYYRKDFDDENYEDNEDETENSDDENEEDIEGGDDNEDDEGEENEDN